jgi:hypothetical protein
MEALMPRRGLEFGMNRLVRQIEKERPAVCLFLALQP